MHLPLIIAVLALLALALLPVLDRSATPGLHAKGLRACMIRVARWAKE
jgi:hypothetical protein